MKTLPPTQHWIGAPRSPRRWQKEALVASLASLRAGKRGLIRACTGAGKSALIAELCHVHLCDRAERIVVSTPTEALVEQLAATIQARLERSGRTVGKYFGRAKELHGEVIITCNPSLGGLLTALDAAKLKVSLWIIDECHGSEADGVRLSAQEMPKAARLGLTATPFRADDDETLSLFDEEIYGYGLDRALADGVVVPFDVVLWEGPTLHIDDACLSMIRAAVQHGPGVVDGVDIEDASRFAELLRSNGLRAEVVHSKMPRAVVAGHIEALEAGSLDVLAHVDLLREGVDIPCLRWVCLRRPRSSRVGIVQYMGRALRTHKGKSRALILDPHGLLDSTDLGQLAQLGRRKTPTEPGEAAAAAALKPTKGTPPATWTRELDVEVDGESGPAATLRALVVALDAAGLVRREVVSSGSMWRRGRPNEAQLASMNAYAHIAQDHGLPVVFRDALREVYEARDSISKGTATDWLVAALWVARWPVRLGRRVPPPGASELLARTSQEKVLPRGAGKLKPSVGTARPLVGKRGAV
jgi:superfamily II DNA or RNA helicase